MSKPFVVCFAGVPGCGKSSVAHFLGITFRLPRFERDKIRNEIKADFNTTDINVPEALSEFNRVSRERYVELIDAKVSYILDSSVDRKWEEVKKEHEDRGYSFLLISFDMSRKWVARVYENFHNEHQFNEDGYFEEHAMFLDEHGVDIDLSITDKTFSDRIKLSEQAMRDFLATI